MADAPKLGTVRVTPVAFKISGYSEVPESDADWFSVSIYENAKGYGVGWFPKYDFGNADAHDYMYKTKARAYAAAGIKEPDTRTLNVTGSCGFMVVTYDGVIVDRSGAGQEYATIKSFDLTHTSVPYDFFELGDVDICYIGMHTVDGYEDPATFEREGTGGAWESYEPRRIELPAMKTTRTITITADSSVMLRHTFEVPADATDDEIHALCEDVDGGCFEEVPNSGDWSQTWD